MKVKLSKLYLIITLSLIINVSFAQQIRSTKLPQKVEINGGLAKGTLTDVDVRDNATKFNACCPPWNADVLKKSMFYKGSGAISDPYTLRFVPTQAFLNQMQLYLNYINSVVSCNTQLTIDFRLHDQGIGNLPITTHWGSGVIPLQTQFVTWSVNTTGIGAPSGLNGFFPGYYLQVGRWYALPTGIYTNCKDSYFSNRECNPNGNHRIYVRIQVTANRAAKSTSQQEINLEVSDGKTISIVKIEKEK